MNAIVVTAGTVEDTEVTVGIEVIEAIEVIEDTEEEAITMIVDLVTDQKDALTADNKATLLKIVQNVGYLLIQLANQDNSTMIEMIEKEDIEEAEVEAEVEIIEEEMTEEEAEIAIVKEMIAEATAAEVTERENKKREATPHLLVAEAVDS